MPGPNFHQFNLTANLKPLVPKILYFKYSTNNDAVLPKGISNILSGFEIIWRVLKTSIIIKDYCQYYKGMK